MLNATLSPKNIKTVHNTVEYIEYDVVCLTMLFKRFIIEYDVECRTMLFKRFIIEYDVECRTMLFKRFIS